MLSCKLRYWGRSYYRPSRMQWNITNGMGIPSNQTTVESNGTMQMMESAVRFTVKSEFFTQSPIKVTFTMFYFTLNISDEEVKEHRNYSEFEFLWTSPEIMQDLRKYIVCVIIISNMILFSLILWFSSMEGVIASTQSILRSTKTSNQKHYLSHHCRLSLRSEFFTVPIISVWLCDSSQREFFYNQYLRFFYCDCNSQVELMFGMPYAICICNVRYSYDRIFSKQTFSTFILFVSFQNRQIHFCRLVFDQQITLDCR